MSRTDDLATKVSGPNTAHSTLKRNRVRLFKRTRDLILPIDPNQWIHKGNVIRHIGGDVIWYLSLHTDRGHPEYKEEEAEECVCGEAEEREEKEGGERARAEEEVWERDDKEKECAHKKGKKRKEDREKESKGKVR